MPTNTAGPSPTGRGCEAPTRPRSRAEVRAAERAERAEWDYLTKRLGQLWPNYDCFCGSLEDLRRTVARLEASAANGGGRGATTGPGRTTPERAQRTQVWGHRGEHHDAASRRRQGAERAQGQQTREHVGVLRSH